ncbi:TonB-dependent receptor [Xanthomonas translucens]|uniref:TonB-dependent outer membrane receptor n=1 Tax=Xanthomonas translucens pv. translucens DSM 18974 TaxID=1261556 RepID=A0A1C3TPT9_XANCT|nr:TonB-dependent receptor [Xanthomonas translucens]MCC8444938.1 TonB-dependent receptor [Xanthomonas translucens pv. translucens]MCT8285902.1 TonB-dependent receptor [Xanthomonas translucens pv. translucens]MCT8303560.1 TonB-dependent receptor [Xanthomonas translucens pv. translucens]QSQ28823.1 TonB-dependent receptor [Xanthomonas translucens pv. translucens]QSQ47074.1 TonB-dependent receptor [Xanthomonas translucens pv. translucens]
MSFPHASHPSHRPQPLALAVVAALSLGAACPALAQEASADDGKPQTLDSIVVTGSRLRRVDTETANPVVTINRAQIEATGKATLGDLVQELPSIAGNATNPNTNNGGGTGASTISLRGLGDKRTLILVNGTRLASNDVNAIPATMIERVEVLSDGASAVYGSDAIGGVVNFILRKGLDGIEASTDFGTSSRSDGNRRSFSLTAGKTGERGSIVAGLSYHNIDPVSAGARSYSKDALSLINGVPVKQGSSATPTGSISFDEGSDQSRALAASNGCSRVTFNGGSGSPTNASQYHCYDAASDSYNYQPYNLLQTPQERTNAFVIGSFRFNDHLEGYVNTYFSKTTSSSIIAPIPIFANGDNFLASADSYYNLFGVNFGTDRSAATSYNSFNSRATVLGNRRYEYDTYNFQINPGLRGSFGDSSWQWDASVNYGKIKQKSINHGFLDYAGFNAAVGPSFLDSDGTVKCGSAGAAIAGCTPIDVFNLNSESNKAALEALVVNPIVTSVYRVKQFEANANGNLFDLPAGTVSLAAGVSYRKESTSTAADPLWTGDENGMCGVIEFCATVLGGSFSVKEAYAEALFPLLADLPLVHSLNLTVGSRFSDYDSVGSKTNSKVSLEYRPIENLLLRGTVSQVFRAPNINELYSGVVGDSATVKDPCNGYNGGHAAACANVPTDGSYQQADNQVGAKASGAVVAGYQLKPETGKSYDFGVVYDPGWLDGLSMSADLWKINLQDTITQVSAQTVLNQCYPNASSAYCALIHRNDNGTINYIAEPTVNLGKLWASGADFSLNYRLPDTALGSFNAGLNGTYVIRYDVNPDSTDPNTVTIHNAGKYTQAYGNFPRWRGLGALSWNLGDWSASWRIRYIGSTEIGSEDTRQSLSSDAGLPHAVRSIGSYVYHNVQVGYNLTPWHTRLELGVDNLADKQPPLYYANNVTNANTDVATYDLLGRYYWARATVKF